MAKYFIFKNDTGENPVNLFKIASSDEEKNFIINNRQFQMNSIVVSDNDFNNAKLKLRSGYVTTDYANFTSTPNDVIKTNSQIFIEFDLVQNSDVFSVIDSMDGVSATMLSSSYHLIVVFSPPVVK
jgi:hypothetical protein